MIFLTELKNNLPFVNFLVLFYVLGCILSPLATAQMLQKDTVDFKNRHNTTKFTNNRYTFGDFYRVDTSLVNFHLNSAADSSDVSYIRYGMLGQAQLPALFSYQNHIGFNWGFNQYQQYAMPTNNMPFYRGQYPYSQIRYVLSGNEEQYGGFTFAHSVKNIHFLLNYDFLNGTRDNVFPKANHGNFYTTFWTHNKNERYNLLAYFYNARSLVFNPGDTISSVNNFEINVIDVNTAAIDYTYKAPSLSDAQETQRKQEWMVQNSYDWGLNYVDTVFTENKIGRIDTSLERGYFPLLRVGHTLKRTRFIHQYDDSNLNVFFYPDFNYSNTTTADSLASRTIENDFWLATFGKKRDKTTRKYKRTYVAKAGFTHQLTNVYQFSGQDTIPIQQINIGETTYNASYDTLYSFTTNTPRLQTGLLHFGFRSNPHFKYLQYQLKAQYALFGFNLADFDVQGNATLNLGEKLGKVSGQLRLARLTPPYLTQFYWGNHYQWNNAFIKTTALQLWASYKNEKLGLKFTYANHTLGSYTVWNELGLPEQLDEAVNISQFIVKQQLKLGSFYMRNTAIFQASTSRKVPLPFYSGRHVFYVQRYLFKKALLAQIGVTVNVNTAFFAPVYAPSIGQFYLQNIRNLPFAPTLDYYGSFQLKRARLFLKYEHLQTALSSQNRLFRFGVNWMFYD